MGKAISTAKKKSTSRQRAAVHPLIDMVDLDVSKELILEHVRPLTNILVCDKQLGHLLAVIYDDRVVKQGSVSSPCTVLRNERTWPMQLWKKIGDTHWYFHRESVISPDMMGRLNVPRPKNFLNRGQHEALCHARQKVGLAIDGTPLPSAASEQAEMLDAARVATGHQKFQLIMDLIPSLSTTAKIQLIREITLDIQQAL